MRASYASDRMRTRYERRLSPHANPALGSLSLMDDCERRTRQIAAASHHVAGYGKPQHPRIQSLTWAWGLAQRRVAHELGLRLVANGRLSEAWGGHRAGAPYLVLRADSSLERHRAWDLLGDIAGITDLMWAHGWTSQRLPSGRIVTDLKIFPGQTPSPLGAVARLADVA